jgi:hypothetical protein
MEKDDVDGRETAQTRQCIQPFWLARLHWLLDASGQKIAERRQLSAGSKNAWQPRSVSCQL